MASGESQKDSREYLREVVRSNGRLGEFWARGQSLCVQIRHPVYGDVRFLVDPEAFGSRGCIFDAVSPKHVGHPFGWRSIGFIEFAKRMNPTVSGRFSSLGRRSTTEARAFVGSSAVPQRRTLNSSHYAIADKAPLAAVDLVRRMHQLTDQLLVDGRRSLSDSLLYRGSTSHPMFPSNMLSLHDLLGEASIFRTLFGHFVRGREKDELDLMISSVRDEVEVLCESLDKYALDVTMLNITMDFLDSYMVNLSRLTSKSLVIPALTRSAMTAFAEEMYYGLLESRTMAENIFAASLLTGHPPDLGRWIAEFRYHDYALRELMDKAFSANPCVTGHASDMSVFYRDRFGYPPEVAWWMWHALEKETGVPLEKAFAFDPREVSDRSGLRTAPPGEVATSLRPEALIGRHVEILIVDSPFGPFFNIVLPNLKVVERTKSELDEEAYFMAMPAEPIVVNLGDESAVTIMKVRFGSSLPRSPPQAVMDDGIKAIMKADPYRRVMVDVSAVLSNGRHPLASGGLTHFGFGLLGLVEAGQPSIFEIQRYRLVQEFVEKRNEEAKAWEVDYRG